MSLASDFSYALRLLARSPIFTVTAVLSLSLGVAGSAAVFSLADALLLRPRVGVSDPANAHRHRADHQRRRVRQLRLSAVRGACASEPRLLDGMTAHRLAPEVMSLGDAESSERVFAALVSGNYFEVVGTRPAVGRFFIPEEDRTPGTHPVVVLSHQFWTRRFTADPAVVGTDDPAEQPAVHRRRRRREGIHGHDVHDDGLLGADGDGAARPRQRSVAPRGARCGVDDGARAA